MISPTSCERCPGRMLAAARLRRKFSAAIASAIRATIAGSMLVSPFTYRLTVFRLAPDARATSVMVARRPWVSPRTLTSLSRDNVVSTVCWASDRLSSGGSRSSTAGQGRIASVRTPRRLPGLAYVVAGPAGSGKSTFGRALASVTGAMVIDQDIATNPLMASLAAIGRGRRRSRSSRLCGARFVRPATSASSTSQATTADSGTTW